MPFCPNCGKNVEAGKRFCENCGTAIAATPPAAPVTPPYTQQPVYQAPAVPHQQKSPHSMMTIIGYIVLGIIIIAIIYFVVIPAVMGLVTGSNSSYTYY
jgi:uncharacterized membrane protein YvbJ